MQALDPRGSRRPGAAQAYPEMSGGQQQRVAIARAIATQSAHHHGR